MLLEDKNLGASDSPSKRQLTLPNVACNLALFALWIGAYVVSGWLEYAPHASLWFPPAAVTFAGFAVFGWRAAPALLLACAVATVLADATYQLDMPWTRTLASAALFGAAHCLAYGGAALLVRRVANAQARSLPRTIAAFLLGGAAAALAAAAGGITGLRLTGMIGPGETEGLLVPWMIGDYAGLVALSPLLLGALAHLGDRLGCVPARGLFAFEMLAGPARELRAPIAKLLLLLGLTLAVFIATFMLPEQPPVVFTIFGAVVIQMWIVHTEGPRQAVASLAAFSIAVAGLTALFGMAEHALTLQFALITVAANTCFGLGVPQLYADNHRLRNLLIHDALTGAYSRTFFIELARQGIARARRNGQPASLLMIDLDHLKAINDQHGHASGDRALKTLARCCRDALRAGDVLGRLSGDEFSVFLPDTTREAAAEIAERLRSSIAALAGELSLPALSASLGVAELAGRDDRYEDLLHRADQALYESKRLGRNRIALN